MKTTNSRVGLSLAIWSLSALSACSSMQVQTAADPHADLSRYKTYAWAPVEEGTSRRPPSILDQALRSSVERELADKGLQPAKEGQPGDVLVAYYGASQDIVNHWPSYGYPSYAYYDTTYVTREGSLTLQLIDPKTKRIVWQGTATDAISDTGASPEQVTEAVTRLLERYPAS